MSDDKIIELGKRMPVEEMTKRHIRVAIKDIEQGIQYSKEAASSLKAFYKCLEEDPSELARCEAELGVTGAKNVIYAAFPDRSREMLDDMLKDA